MSLCDISYARITATRSTTEPPASLSAAAAVGSAVPAVPADGRTARRDRNRNAVLDAVVALFREDNLRPRPEEVAERSGVSLRSVYRYYSDSEELLQAAMARHYEAVRPKLGIAAMGQGGLEDRIDRFVEARLDLYDRVAPTARAARIAAVGNAAIRERFETTRAELRAQVGRHFRPELSELPLPRRQAVTAAIDALVQLDTIDYWCLRQGWSRRRVADVLRMSCAQLLIPPPR